MDPQQNAIAEEFDKYRHNYADAVNRALSFSGLKVDFFTRVKADYLRAVLRDTFGGTDELRVLDVGCGVGSYHPLLKHDIGQLVGVDVSTACVAQAEKTNPEVGYDTYDGTRLPYDDASFDAAFTICVMHHVPPQQWPVFVAEMMRVLRPGGLALVFEHNPRNPLTLRVVNRCPFDKDAVLLDARKTFGLFADGGFEQVERRFILTVPAVNAALRKIDGLFAALPLGAQYYISARKPGSALGEIDLRRVRSMRQGTGASGATSAMRISRFGLVGILAKGVYAVTALASIDRLGMASSTAAFCPGFVDGYGFAQRGQL